MISLISNPLEATSVATSTGAKPIYETQTLYEHELHNSSSPVTPQEVIFSDEIQVVTVLLLRVTCTILDIPNETITQINILDY